MFVSYISVISQQIVPVTSNNWKLPTLKVVKENIWKDIQVLYILDIFYDSYTNILDQLRSIL